MFPDAPSRRRWRRRTWLAVAVAALALAFIPLSFHAERRLETAMQMEGSEAQSVAEELSKQFRSPFVHRVTMVIHGIPAADSEEGKSVLREVTDTLRKEPGVAGALSRLDWADPVFLGRDGGTFVVAGLDPGSAPVETLIPRLRAASDQLQARLRPRYPAVRMQWTGETPLNFDLRKTSADDARAAELRILPVTLLLLLAAFGSLVAALLPLSVGWLAISMTMGCAAFLARFLHLSILVQNVATMLGLGLGIDYALLMVSRFREGLDEARNPLEASEIAARDAGHTLVVSATTVAIGFAALSTVPVSELRSIGVAGLLVVCASLLLSIMLLPVLLGLLGRRVDLGRLPLLKAGSAAAAAASRNRWRSWGFLVSAHPWKSLILAGAPLLLLASQAFRLETGLPAGHWLPENAESVQALHSLEAMGRAGLVQSLRVVLELPPGITVPSEAGWQALDRLSRRLAEDRRAERVISLPSLLGQGRGPAFLRLLPESTRRSFLRADDQAALLEVLPASGVTPSQQEEWVRELRRRGAPDLCGLPGATLRIGGIPALNADYEALIAGRMLPVVALVIGGTLAALLLGFRAVLVAVKAVALNLLSVGAALGALVLVFQDGHGGTLMGLPGGTGAVFPIVPILAFAVVFGLSMDYEVFLVARVLEARRSGLDETDAIAEGLARTGGLITSAAAIMVAVFSAFVFGNFLLVRMLGFTLAVAVLLDAVLVRTIIGPALLRLAGDWNWWPGGLGRPSANDIPGACAPRTRRLEVRQLDRRHNAEMLAILEASPIDSGGLSITFDRRPDIFTAAELKYDPAVYAGLFCDDRLAGFALLGIHPALVGGAARPVMHLTDLYLAPGIRGGGHCARFLPFFLGEHGRGTDLGYAVVMRGNRPAEALMDRDFSGFPMAPCRRFIGDLDVRNILLTTRRPETTGVPVREARMEDVEQIVALLQVEHEDRLFGLVVDRDTFVANLSKRPGFGIESYRVTEEQGRVTGVAAAWDTNSFKQNRVVRYSLRMRLVRGVTNLLAPLAGWGRLPAPGGSLRDAFITDWAVKERNPRLLAALLDRIYTEYRHRGYNSLIFGSAADDPLLEATRGFSFLSVLSRIALLATNARRLEESSLKRRLPFIDVALL